MMIKRQNNGGFSVQKKTILSGAGISLGVAGALYITYRRLMKVTSRAYKNAKNDNVEE